MKNWVFFVCLAARQQCKNDFRLMKMSEMLSRGCLDYPISEVPQKVEIPCFFMFQLSKSRGKWQFWFFWKHDPMLIVKAEYINYILENPEIWWYFQFSNVPRSSKIIKISYFAWFFPVNLKVSFDFYSWNRLRFFSEKYQLL